MDLLKRQLAPILDEAWDEIDEEARRVLALQLGGRKLVDFDGPHGWRHAAVNLGTLEPLAKPPEEGLDAALRQVQPLAEIRAPFTLELADLDAVSRGAHDPDLEPVVEAAEKMARLENRTLFHGSEALGVTGVIPASPHPPRPLPEDASRYPHAVVEAAETLRQAGINGPYALALGPEAYGELSQAAEDGYPIRKRVGLILDGPIVRAPALDGAVLMSRRGGDYALTVGQDLAIGYSYHDRERVDLFLVESFTFRVLEPAAAIHLEHGS
jgi:uncharacterized linocin/CFP29 family protein